MIRAQLAIARFLGRFGRDQRGVSAAFFALLLTAFVGMTGMAVDFGHAYLVKQALQASTNAAALAGGENIPNSTAIATATNYSAEAGKLNANANIPVSSTNFSATLECLSDQVTNIGSCVGTEKTGGANAIVVQQTTAVPTYFLVLAGVHSINITTTATASAFGGPGTPLNVMVVLDATESMSTAGSDPACGLGSQSSSEQCAKAGLAELLKVLSSSADYVGLMVFPGNVSASSSAADDCGTGATGLQAQDYSNSPVYTVASPANGFNTNGTLTGSAGIVQATGLTNVTTNGTTTTETTGSCAGVTAKGGAGTYYAGVINAAQTALVNFQGTLPGGGKNTQNVIILLSDGNAGSSDTQINFQGFIQSGILYVTTCNGCATSSTVQQQGPLAVGDSITGTGVPTGTVISAFGPASLPTGCKPTATTKTPAGTGSTGTYSVNTGATTVGTCQNPVALVATQVVTYNSTNYTMNTQQCHQAISAAQQAANAGTWVYSIAYGSETTGCSTDTNPTITPCETMQGIANSPGHIPDASRFYSNGSPPCTGAQSFANVVSAFETIAESLREPRLIPNGTT